MPTVFATTRDQPQVTPPAGSRAIPYPFILNFVEGWADKERPARRTAERAAEQQRAAARRG